MINKTLFLTNVALVCALLYITDKNIINNDHPPEIVEKKTPSLFTLGASEPPAPGVQVNSLPHPFNLNGSMPYQVWVNGERLPLKGDKAKQIVDLLDLEPFEQPEDTKEIHSGAGWLRPLPATTLQ